MKQLFTSLLFLLISTGIFCQSKLKGFYESFEQKQLAEVFEILKNKYALDVAYQYEAIENISISKTIQSNTLEVGLQELFANTGLEFRLIDNKRLLVRTSAEAEPHEALQEIFTYSFEGKVLDKHSKLPLAFATVYCPSSNVGITTDETGEFSLKIESTQKNGTIVIQYLGYIPRVISWKAGEDFSNLQIKLQAKTLEFKEITILEQLPTFSLNQEDGGMVFRGNQLNALPSFVGTNDIFRGLQLLPGISATDDLSAELRIRGSGGEENMIILDGITLYNVDHYFGVFSAINGNIIDEVKLYKNAFPVEYGGRTAGIIDFYSHPIENRQVSGIIQADLLTSNAYLSVPINEQMGLLFGGRTTNIDVADTDLFALLQANQETINAGQLPQIQKGDPTFRFYDLNAKWLWDISPQSSIRASFFQSYDKFKYDYIRIDTTRANRNQQDRRREIAINTEIFDEERTWNNQGIGLQLNHQWEPRWNTQLNLSYSTFDESQVLNSSLIRQIERLPPRPLQNLPNPPPTNIIRIDTTIRLTNRAFNAIVGKELNVKNTYHIDDKQQLTFGYHYVNNNVKIDFNADDRVTLGREREADQHAAYLQYNLETKNNFRLGLGLRNTYYSITEKNYLSPRVSLSHRATDELNFKATYSKYYQFLRRNYREDRFGVAYEFWVLGSDRPNGFPISSSEQFMLGFNFLKDGFEIDVEAYHKKIDGVSEFALQENGFGENNVAPIQNPTYTIFNGKGTYKGIDVLLKKSTGNYTGWLAYTLSKNEHSFPQIDNGTYFPSQDDQRHQINWTNQYRIKNFELSATFIYSSGRPYTDLERIAEIQERDRRNLRPEDRISFLPDYYRVDVGASYNFDWGRTQGRLGASIFNVFDRQNVKYRQYIYSIPNQRNENLPDVNEVRGTDLLLLGFTPNVSFSLHF